MAGPYFIYFPSLPFKDTEVPNTHLSDKKEVILNQLTLYNLGFRSVCFQWFSVDFSHIYMYKPPKCLLLLKLYRKLIGFMVAI